MDSIGAAGMSDSGIARLLRAMHMDRRLAAMSEDEVVEFAATASWLGEERDAEEALCEMERRAFPGGVPEWLSEESGDEG